ncbi:hypothetical protein A2671_01940 [Candidatus Kaiserbacteria bacterium RIFCSPHIGHO2_01_FULL_49_13]|uniref:Zn-dependent hydrolase n=1 Tax=Candidatus Kaiserbacteria bacterium RIFCSPHIGHO2_01_FULL_49_13 TaxID=1798477 RepID=A0A1F6CE77_9BACT|nr:MAG: hypothetical protein A2671_01940 [Candidatus Kaiserbacteria bacterium RIFCSPHIGHO2_01_FULL_49_13]
MVITHHGAEFFKITFGDTTLAVNPISKSSKLPQTRFGADIVLISMLDPVFDGVENVTYGEKQPFVVQGPGEYEVKKIFIRGSGEKSKLGEEERQGTVYAIEMEGMHLAFLGPLSSRKLSPQTMTLLENIDILFVPIGGEGVLTASDAHELAVELEPRLIIPMHYEGIGKPGALKAFLKEEGAEGTKPIEKLTLKKKDLEGKEGEVVVLNSL